MIQKSTILIPYTQEAKLKEGTTYSPEGNSILITGPSGSGKSTLLHMIYESIRINRSKKIQPTFHTHVPNFLQSNSLLKQIAELGGTDPDPDYREFSDILVDDNLPVNVHEVIEEELGENTNNKKREELENKYKKEIIQTGLNTIIEHLQLKKFSNEFAYEKPLEEEYIASLALKYSHLINIAPMNAEVFQNQIYQYNNYLKTLFREDPELSKDVTEYTCVIKEIAKQHNVSPEKLYSICSLIDRNLLGAFETDFSNWLFMKHEGDNEFISAMYNIPGEKMRRVSTINEKGTEIQFEEVKGSSGEQDKKYMNKLFKNNGIILLDEPMANLDEKSQDEFGEKIFNLAEKGNQMIVVSHERFFNKEARKNNWYEIEIK